MWKSVFMSAEEEELSEEGSSLLDGREDSGHYVQMRRPRNPANPFNQPVSRKSSSGDAARGGSSKASAREPFCNAFLRQDEESEEEDSIVVDEKGEVFERSVFAPEVQMRRRNTEAGGRKESKETTLQAKGLDTCGNPTILQFTCAVYFVEESEGVVQIDIMRLGSKNGRVSCYFYTEDGSGKEGKRYEANEGEVVFEDGEYRKTVEVGITQMTMWAATLEFGVKLCNPEGCTLGLYLQSCRVKVISDHSFPSDKYPQVASDIAAIKAIGGAALFWEYWKMNFCVEGIAWRTMLTLLMDQTKNVYLFYKLWAMSYMLNELFISNWKTEDPSFDLEERLSRAMIIGVGYILPMFLLHGWDLASNRLDISGLSCIFLQQSVLRKYLNYNEESRSTIKPADIHSIVRETSYIMADGYMALLTLLRLSVKLAVMLYFTFRHNTKAIGIVMIMPTLMAVFGYLRNDKLTEAIEKPEELDSDMLAFVSDTAKNYRLISNYQQRPKINMEFAKKSAAAAQAKIGPTDVVTNNDYFTRWLGPVFVGCYIIFEAKALLTGHLGHGTFVATLSIFSEISDSFSEGFQQVNKISSLAGPLNTMTEMLNRPTDLRAWKGLNRWRREQTKAARKEIFEKHTADANNPFLTDLIELQVKNVGFAYDTSPGKWKLKNVNLSVNQGKLVAVHGGHGEGRQTFLSLLAHENFPTEGHIFIPTHLRILQVSQEAYIINQPVVDNLGLGVKLGTEEIQRMRVVLDRMDFKDADVLATIAQSLRDHEDTAMDSDGSDASDGSAEKCLSSGLCCAVCTHEAEELDTFKDGSFQKTLTYTDLVKLHIARALVMNPEVLVLQRPLFHFNPSESNKLLDLLQEHCKNRGVGLPPQNPPLRRPRTVILSVDSDEQAKRCDVVWKMQKLDEDSYTVVPA